MTVHTQLCGIGELHTLRERCLIREVECTCAPAHILFPGISTRFAAPASALYVRGHANEYGRMYIPWPTHLIATKCCTNLCATGANIHLSDANH